MNWEENAIFIIEIISVFNRSRNLIQVTILLSYELSNKNVMQSFAWIILPFLCKIVKQVPVMIYRKENLI